MILLLAFPVGLATLAVWGLAAWNWRHGRLGEATTQALIGLIGAPVSVAGNVASVSLGVAVLMWLPVIAVAVTAGQLVDHMAARRKSHT